jgi:hypothetical protein
MSLDSMHNKMNLKRKTGNSMAMSEAIKLCPTVDVLLKELELTYPQLRSQRN